MFLRYIKSYINSTPVFSELNMNSWYIVVWQVWNTLFILNVSTYNRQVDLRFIQPLLKYQLSFHKFNLTNISLCRFSTWITQIFTVNYKDTRMLLNSCVWINAWCNWKSDILSPQLCISERHIPSRDISIISFYFQNKSLQGCFNVINNTRSGD